MLDSIHLALLGTGAGIISNLPPFTRWGGGNLILNSIGMSLLWGYQSLSAEITEFPVIPSWIIILISAFFFGSVLSRLSKMWTGVGT